MELTVRTVDLPGPMKGLLVRPAVAAPLPGLVLVQEIWGVDGHIQDVARRLAAAGYTVLAPELYTRGARPASLSPERIEAVKSFLDGIPPQAWAGLPDPAQREPLLRGRPEPERRLLDESLAAMFPPSRAAQLAGWTADLAAAAAWLRAEPGVGGRPVGAIGFCVGGALAAALATVDPALAAAAVFYGQPPPAERLAAIRCPVLGIYGGDDPRLVQQLPAFEQGMAAAGRSLELHVVPGAPHAFFNDTRASYRPDPARHAWARALAFLAAAIP